jgi:hypothetical protein
MSGTNGTGGDPYRLNEALALVGEHVQATLLGVLQRDTALAATRPAEAETEYYAQLQAGDPISVA